MATYIYANQTQIHVIQEGKFEQRYVDFTI